MSRIISRAESFERVYEAFNTVNFSSFDFNAIKQSLIDYVKLYFPEDFRDYIESSEFIAILELFAYVGELLAYRIDINAHENFLTTAQRKDAVLRLAKFISYKASRNIPLRGFVKLNSIQTTEAVFDSAGRNLAGRRILWNDPANSDWKEQFLLVMDLVLKQNFGSVTPDERVQVDDVLFELYTLINSPISLSAANVFKYTAASAGTTLGMELVPVELDKELGPIEKRPEIRIPFTLLYATDGLGDASDTTGFLMYTKQGALNRVVNTFDGVTPNQTFDLAFDNINDTDIWVNNIDPDTGAVIDDDPQEAILPKPLVSDTRFGEWIEVDIANAQNVIFNTNTNRRKYEVETLDDDQVRLIFGDGEFADIPNGSFEIWYRTSQAEDVILPKNSVIGQGSSFSYVDTLGSVQTLSFTFSLVSSLLNNSISEDIEHVRNTAPSVYYTQDRMVNAKDYNTFMLSDPSILKLKSVNRTFAGDSKYIAWHDPREFYENVKIFGDDLALYFQGEDPSGGHISIVNTPLSANSLILNILQPFLSSTDFFLILGPLLEAKGLDAGTLRRVFDDNDLSCNPGTGEIEAIADALDPPSFPLQVDLFYSVPSVVLLNGFDEWTVGPHCTDPDSVWMFRINAVFVGSEHTGWEVRTRTRQFIAHSESTRFWNSNNTDKIVNYDTLATNQDNIIVLKANISSSRLNPLPRNIPFNVVSQALLEQNLSNAGLPDIHRLSIINEDANNDSIPDNLSNPELFNLIAQSNPDVTCPDPNFIFSSIPGRGFQRVLLDDLPTTFTTTGLNDVIVGVVNGSPGQFRVKGNRTLVYTAGIAVNVANSECNNGNYTVSLAGSTYNALTDETTIPVDEFVCSATVDGTLAPTWSTDVSVDGGLPIMILIQGNDAATYETLLDELNAALTGATATFNGVDITIFSDSVGPGSTISITDPLVRPLFTSLIHFNSFEAPVAGLAAEAFILTLPFNIEYISGHESEDLKIWVSKASKVAPPAVPTPDPTPVFPDDFIQLKFGADWIVPIFPEVDSEEANGIVKRKVKIFATLFDTDALVDDIVFDPNNYFLVLQATDYVYFTRSTNQDPWVPVSDPDDSIKQSWAVENHTTQPRDNWMFNRQEGRSGLNFAWFHRSPRFHLVDPSATNIIDTFIITKGYYNSVRRFLDNKIDVSPATPTPLDLRISYANFIDNRMISDSLILHPGKLKVLFGSKATPELQATFKIIRPTSNFFLTDNEVKVRVKEVIKSFLDINSWEFGETFYFSELGAAIHRDLGTEIDSIAIVPLFALTQFGDLFVVPSREDEIFIADVDTDDIEIVRAYTPEVLRQLE